MRRVENGDAVVFYLGAWNEREWEHEREAGEWTTLWRESRPMPVSATRLVSQPLSVGQTWSWKQKNNENRARRLRSRHLAGFIYRPLRRSRDFRQHASEMSDPVWTIVNVFLRNLSNFDARFRTLISLSKTACMKFARESTIEDATFTDTFFSSRDAIIFSLTLLIYISYDPFDRTLCISMLLSIDSSWVSGLVLCERSRSAVQFQFSHRPA